jgi:hypothetical protein
VWFITVIKARLTNVPYQTPQRGTSYTHSTIHRMTHKFGYSRLYTQQCSSYSNYKVSVFTQSVMLTDSPMPSANRPWRIRLQEYLKKKIANAGTHITHMTAYATSQMIRRILISCREHTKLQSAPFGNASILGLFSRGK